MTNDAQIADLLKDLNEPQRRAVTHRDGPLLVLAGPGSGKTRVITRRAAHLVQTGVSPYNILAITFTNKAADEMKRRIEELGVGRGMWVCTFHALGVRLLREFGPLAHVQPGFTIYDEDDRLRVIKEAMEACHVGEHILKPEDVQNKISHAKNRMESPQEYAAGASFFEGPTIARVYEMYEQLLRQRNAVDFDDLLMRVALTLKREPEITERLNQRFQYVLIDEYQDTNQAQYLIARRLSQHHRNLCATGDPDQSIYGWRGADIGNILKFERDYPNATVVRLEQNYRSTGRILRAASKLISANQRRKHKDLWTENGEGERTQVSEFADGYAEADHIAETILALRRAGRSYSDFAIVYRVNALSRGLEQALRDRGIPYKIARGVEFYNRKEIKDVLAYLRVVVNPTDQVSLLRIINTPTRGIGKTTIDRVLAAAQEMNRSMLEILRDAHQIPALQGAADRLGAFVELLDRMRAMADQSVTQAVSGALSLSGLEAFYKREQEEKGEDRLANARELVTAAADYEQNTPEPALADFLQRISLVSDQDAIDEEVDCVWLMTLHAAKGLEFPVVFIAGLEQGVLPHERSLRGHGDIEEERRLCFVGITRAKERLYLSHARQRTVRGMAMSCIPSQFLREFPADAVEHRDLTREDDGFGGSDDAGMEFGERGRGEDADSRASNENWGDRDEFPPARDAWEKRRGADTEPAPRGGPRPEGFVPLDDHLPPEETRRSFGRGPRNPAGGSAFSPGRRFNAPERRGPPAPRRSEFDFPTTPPSALPAKPDSPYADWKPGTLVQHEQFGVGQVVWLQPNANQTRAAIRFAGYGEKVFILELAPVRKLERGKI